MPEEKEGLFDTIQRSKNHYQKRAYQCIKCMVQLFTRCSNAHQLLHVNPELKKKWLHAIDWLQDELEKVFHFVRLELNWPTLYVNFYTDRLFLYFAATLHVHGAIHTRLQQLVAASTI